MPFAFSCPSCGAGHSAPDHLIGRRVRCPQCQQAITVPQPPRPVAPSGDDDEEAVLSMPEREKVESEMDMTPMVDVTFLLLIFFMVTASFSLQKSIQSPLPQTDEASTNAVPDEEDDEEMVTVLLDEFNTYVVIAPDWEEEAPSEQELIRQLKRSREPGPSGIVPNRLLVKAHGDALHAKVVAALDAGVEVGMEQVQVLTVEELE